MLKRLGYYTFFALLIVIFGLSGLSDVLSSRFVFIISGTVIALSLAIALWLTITRKNLHIIDTEVPSINTKTASKKSKGQNRIKKQGKRK